MSAVAARRGTLRQVATDGDACLDFSQGRPLDRPTSVEALPLLLMYPPAERKSCKPHGNKPDGRRFGNTGRRGRCVRERETEVVVEKRPVEQVFETKQRSTRLPVRLNACVRMIVGVAARGTGEEIISSIVHVQPKHQLCAYSEAAQVHGGSNRRRVIVENEQVVREIAVITWLPRGIQGQIEVVAVGSRVSFIRGYYRTITAHKNVETLGSRCGYVPRPEALESCSSLISTHVGTRIALHLPKGSYPHHWSSQ